MTRTDVGARAWVMEDAVTRLRLWATERWYPAPPATTPVTIGSGADCEIRVHDDRVSRRHAELIANRRRVLLRDAGSKNGVLLDGARRELVVLEPGDELGIGGVTFVAESARWIALHAFLARLLGWGPEHAEAVDLAMRAVRAAIARRAPLVVAGEGDVVAIARALHARTLGDDRPFVLCDPRRQPASATVRSAENHTEALPALGAASGGTLCVWSRRLPHDFELAAAALRDPNHRVQLIACTHDAAEATIAIPALATRAADLERIVDAYGADATAALGPGTWLTARDRAWVLAHAATSLSDIEKATLRIAALRRGGSITRAAQLLGMSHVALTEWIARRRPPSR
ncbi:MAG: FHA domain-containing protein [Deltaproteobacteria bacterium]|nr:FHA domain-containing protein [Deltaproteobacteria bacterium]MCW5808486.1 FHA domain-containing protein [Deltaproteobacteria bacterium]